MFKKILIGIVSIVIAIFAFIKFVTMPTPEFMRNKEIDGVKMEAKISDDDRNPIIRTFAKEEFDNFDEPKILDINDDVAGRIEGDLPCIHLLNDNKIYISFYKDGQKIDPEKTNLKITAHASHYNDPVKKREIEGKLTKENDKTYTFATKRYTSQYEKYFLEYLRFEISYTIEGKDYVSIFATFQGNAVDATDFFDNEDLNPPIPSEDD